MKKSILLQMEILGQKFILNGININNLTLGSKSDWRLPNVKELGSIVYNSLSSPTIDSTASPSTLSLYYWSSTTSLPQTSYAALSPNGKSQSCMDIALLLKC